MQLITIYRIEGERSFEGIWIWFAEVMGGKGGILYYISRNYPMPPFWKYDTCFSKIVEMPSCPLLDLDLRFFIVFVTFFITSCDLDSWNQDIFLIGKCLVEECQNRKLSESEIVWIGKRRIGKWRSENGARKLSDRKTSARAKEVLLG